MSIAEQTAQEKLKISLSSHVSWSLLSERGKLMFFPTGIVWQTEQASNTKIKATAGVTLSNNKPIMLQATSDILPKLSAAESVSYAPVAGVLDLRKEWLLHIQKHNPSIEAKNISLPVVTSGLTHGISTILGLCITQGEEVISPNMFWENYSHIVETSLGGKIQTFPMFTEEGNIQFNTTGLQQAIEQSAAKQGKAVVLLNFPNNPTGYSITKDDLTQLQKTFFVCAEKGIPTLVLCDDAYFGLFYEDNVYPHSVFSALSSLHKNILAVKIDGATKELFVWGLRTGFLTFGCKDLSDDVKNALENKVKGALRASVTSSSTLSQNVVLRMLQNTQLDVLIDEQKLKLQKKYLLLKKTITEASTTYPESGLVPCPVNSGYFMSFVCNKVDADTLRTHLIQKESLGLISLGDGKKTFLRLTFSALDLELIPTVVNTIYREAQNISSK